MYSMSYCIDYIGVHITTSNVLLDIRCQHRS